MENMESMKRILILGALFTGVVLASVSSGVTSAEAKESAEVSSIYWAERILIRKIDQSSIPLTIFKSGMGAAAVQPTVDNLEGNIKSIAVDVDNQLIYWANHKYQRIGRATLTGGSVEEKFITNAGGVIGIVLDNTNDMLYWTDIKNGSIQRVDLADPSLTPEVLYSKKNAPGLISRPYGIALDVPDNMVYWTDVATRSIQRAPMTGGAAADVEDLVSSKKFPSLKHFNSIRGIALDPDNDRMYWAIFLPGKIQYTDLDGNDAPVTLKQKDVDGDITNLSIAAGTKLTRPEWVAIDTHDDMLYWTQTRTHLVAIKRAKLDLTSNVTEAETVVDFLDIHATAHVHKPTGLALVYPPSGTSPAPALPDLVVDVAGSPSAIAGDMIGSLSITVSNVGGLSAPTAITLVVNTDWSGFTGSLPAVSVPTTGIPAGTYYTWTFDHVIPASGPWGNALVLCVEVDPHPGTHDELDESNNSDCHTVKIVDPLPDLEVQISGPSTATPGDNLSSLIKVIAVNSGLGPAQSGYAVDLVLSTDQVVPPGHAVFSSNFQEDALLKGGRYSGVTVPAVAQATVTVVGSLTIASDTPVGSYFLCARIDPFDDVEESNEPGASNVSCIPIQILGGP